MILGDPVAGKSAPSLSSPRVVKFSRAPAVYLFPYETDEPIACTLFLLPVVSIGSPSVVSSLWPSRWLRTPVTTTRSASLPIRNDSAKPCSARTGRMASLMSSQRAYGVSWPALPSLAGTEITPLRSTTGSFGCTWASAAA